MLILLIHCTMCKYYIDIMSNVKITYTLYIVQCDCTYYIDIVSKTQNIHLFHLAVRKLPEYLV